MTKNDEILIIYTSWYTDFINEMMGAALERLGSEDCMIKSFKAPGSLEIPALAKAKITSKTKGILAIGIIIRGETSHYDIVANESAAGLTQLSISKNIIVTNSILTVENKQQALDRSLDDTTNKGYHAAYACNLLLDIKNGKF